jgi:hypothetical protein
MTNEPKRSHQIHDWLRDLSLTATEFFSFEISKNREHCRKSRELFKRERTGFLWAAMRANNSAEQVKLKGKQISRNFHSF